MQVSFEYVTFTFQYIVSMKILSHAPLGVHYRSNAVSRVEYDHNQLRLK